MSDALASALIRNALEDITRPLPVWTRWSRQYLSRKHLERVEDTVAAYCWVFGDEDTGASLSFDDCCHVLNMDADAKRDAIRRRHAEALQRIEALIAGDVVLPPTIVYREVAITV